jgi:hypothetical protein
MLVDIVVLFYVLTIHKTGLHVPTKHREQRLRSISIPSPLEELHLLNLLSSDLAREASNQIYVDSKNVTDVLEPIDELGRLEQPALCVQRKLSQLQIAVISIQRIVKRGSNDGFDPQKTNWGVSL